MGIIKAVVDSVSGGLADQWLEVIEPDEMNASTLMVKGVKIAKSGRRGTNTKSSDNTISNGSVIHVYPNQLMLILEGGKVVDYSAEEGYFTFNTSTVPSMFSGGLKASIADTFERIKFGGIPSTSQRVYYINLSEITGFKFGTPSALNYFDNFYNAELFLRCNGSYTLKITDPLKFYKEIGSRSLDKSIDVTSLSSQYLGEFVNALQATIAQMSIDGVRISNLNAKTMELSKYMAKALDEDWNNLRGMEICSVAINSLSYDEESKKLIQMRNQGAMMSDPTVREGFVQSSIAQGIQAAGSNTAGAANAFMGMNMGMGAAGGFMQSASANNMAQMQAQQQAQQVPQQVQNGWTCSCGQANNSGKFCANCGAAKPAPAGSWKCSCGTENTGKFCANCGAAKPAPAGSWKCSCGAENTGKFCAECGKPQA